jgi:hypothetical protein
MFTKAEAVLREFGNLEFGPWHDNVKFDPSAAEDAVDEIRRYSELLGRKLYPLGVWGEDTERIFILIDETGIVYTLIDRLEPLASCFDRALEFLIWRYSSRDKMRDHLRQAGLFGKEWRVSPE